VLSRLEKIFNETNIKYVIVGGIALIHYGHVRTTQDIDLIIENDPSKIPHLISLLKDCDFDVMSDQLYKGYKEKTNVTVFDNRSYLRLDIKFAENEYDNEVIKNARQVNILGKSLLIAPLEYVLIGKIMYIGKIEDLPDSELLEYHDVIDFLTLFHVNKANIDLDFLKKKIKDLGLHSTLKRLIEIRF